MTNLNNNLEKYEKIVRGIAYKFSVNENMTRYSREDLEQDLWLKVVEISENGTADEKLVARCLWNHVTDKYRFHRRRALTQIPAHSQELLEVNDSSETSETADSSLMNVVTDADSDWIVRWKPMETMDYTLIHQTIELFEVGSKERIYAIAKLLDEGLLDLDDKYASEVKDEYLKLDNYKEANFCSLLGYNTKKVSGSWLSKRKAMRQTIASSLGI